MTLNFRRLLKVPLVIVLFACLIGNTYAVDEQKSAVRNTSSAADAQKLLSEVAGVYKKRFKNSTVNDEDYESEDILEIVPINKTAAYVRMELAFFNGHSCSLSTVFEYESNRAFIAFADDYRAPGYGCTMKMEVGYKALRFLDISKGANDCKIHCGARGSLDEVEFTRSKKRKIRYMSRLVNGRHFKSATENYSVEVPEGK